MKNIKHILVVEDHIETASTIKLYLEDAGFVPCVLHDGIEALRVLEKETFELVILDIMLPGIDGRSILERIREDDDTPVILLTALAHENQRIEGFNLGADDYMVKPFSPKELVARVRARLKEKKTHQRKILEQGSYRIVFDERRAEHAGKSIQLTPTEFDIFAILIASPLRVFTRTDLAEKLFGYGYDGDEKTIATHIHNLRKSISSVVADTACIKTIFGVGYCFDPKDPIS